MSRPRKTPGPVSVRMPAGLEMRDLADLIPYAKNARTHTDVQVGQIALSIRTFGWTNPVLVDQRGEIIAGHGRVLAAELLGLVVVPVIVLAYLTKAQKKALRIADNKLALNAGWDDDLLAAELAAIREAGLDPTLTGHTEQEIDDLLARLGNETGGGNTDPDAVPPAPATPVSQLGDLWALGPHRLICGDSRQPAVVQLLLDRVVPSLMTTDVPYGVEYQPEWRDEALGKSKKGGRAKGKVQNDDTASWLDAYKLFAGPVAYVWHDALAFGITTDELKQCGFEARAQIIWSKNRAAVGRGHYHWQHESCVYVVRKGKTASWHGDRTQTTLWEVAHNVSETGHGTQKPVEVFRRPMLNHTSAGQAVYDPFCGSGTSLIAGTELNRIVYGVDIDPVYVDVAAKRWQEFTGEQAQLLHETAGPCGPGWTLERVAADRGIQL